MPGEEGATLKMRRYLSILLTIVMMISGLMPGALAEDDTVYEFGGTLLDAAGEALDGDEFVDDIATLEDWTPEDDGDADEPPEPSPAEDGGAAAPEEVPGGEDASDEGTSSVSPDGDPASPEGKPLEGDGDADEPPTPPPAEDGDADESPKAFPSGEGGADESPKAFPSGEGGAAAPEEVPGDSPEEVPGDSPEEVPGDPDALIVTAAEEPTEAEIDFDAEEADAAGGDADAGAEAAAEAEGAEATEETEEQTDEDAACDAAAMDGTHTHDNLTFTAWGNETSEKTAMPTNPGSYYLTDNVTLDNTWSVPEGTVNLCLNGHGIILQNGQTGSVITISDGATLSLYDEGVGEHKYNLTNGLAKLADDGNETFNGGYITGGNGMLGGVRVNGGTFNMFGGTIIGNAAIGGGGVYVGVAGTYNMSGGSVTGNTTNSYGGGVYVGGGEFTMSGGSISSNTASWSGGGVYVDGGSTFEMYGDSISSNTASYSSGGGVYVAGGSTFKISGKPVIEENKKSNDPNDVYLPDGQKITVIGELKAGARIGVTMANPGAFTSGYGSGGKESTAYTNPADPSDYFFSDDSDYDVVATIGSSETEAALAVINSATKYCREDIAN